MAVEYLFIGATFTFVMSLTMNILGLESDFPESIFYLMFACVSSLLCGWLLLGSDVAWMVAVMILFWGVGLLDFIFVVLVGVRALDIYRKEKRGIE